MEDYTTAYCTKCVLRNGLEASIMSISHNMARSGLLPVICYFREPGRKFDTVGHYDFQGNIGGLKEEDPFDIVEVIRDQHNTYVHCVSPAVIFSGVNL